MREAGAIAYAKVNFTLDILDRRPDGYHDIRSIMQTISIADTLHIRLATGHRGIKLTVHGDHADAAPVDDSNLVLRAVRAVLAEADIDENTLSLDVDLTKGIPAQAGLGGGSSDAAAALDLTSRFFDLGLADDVLLRLASSLGSDVPFFLTGNTCLVEGAGDKVTPLEGKLCTTIGKKHIVVCKPNVNVSTALAYGQLDKAREGNDIRRNSSSAWLSAFETGRDLPLWNDFEPIILSLYPEIVTTHYRMMELGATLGASRPLLCGSGAAIFCMVNTAEHADQLAQALKSSNAGWVSTAHTCGGGIDLL